MKIAHYLVYFLATVSISNSDSITDFIKCQVCRTKKLNGKISDCDCDFESVNGAVKDFYAPLLANITSRYFLALAFDI
jgi:hypothetical protein